MTTFTRGDFLSKRGVAVITDSLTFVGTGGVDPAVVDGLPHVISYVTTMDGTQATAQNTSRLAVGSAVKSWRAPKAGSVIGITGTMGTVLATGEHVTFTLKRGATANTTVILNLTSGEKSDSATFAKGAVAFTAGQLLGVVAEWAALDTETGVVDLIVEM